MADEKYLMFSLEDEKSKKLGEVISNSSCKKIMNVLADGDMSETDLAKKLNMPTNTVEYNLKNLVSAGLVEKSRHWWSVKGKKIETYKLANKLIVISPKKSISSKLSGIVPVAVISGVFAGLLGWYYKYGRVFSARNVVQNTDKALESEVVGSISSYAPDAVQSMSSPGNPWLWILGGSLITLILFILFYWKKL